jgi:hypothetical protein
LAELGPDATAKEVTDYILGKDPSVPRSYISLAMRNLKLSAARKRSRTQKPRANPSQDTLDFPEE